MPGAPYAGFACGLLLRIVVARPARHRRASIMHPPVPSPDPAVFVAPASLPANRAATLTSRSVRLLWNWEKLWKELRLASRPRLRFSKSSFLISIDMEAGSFLFP